VRRLRGERKNLTFAVECRVHRTYCWSNGMGCYCRRQQISLIFYSRPYVNPMVHNEVLGSIVMPYVKSIEEGIFQQDNARPHIARASLAFLEEEEIELLP
jgi:hypothetical protein